LKVERLPKYLRTETYEIKEDNWKITNDTRSDNFTPIVQQVIESNKSVHIDGPGGTGKTYLVKQLQQELTKLGKTYISLAPTNKASRLIKGKTIHKCIFECNKKVQSDMHIDYIFIDEVSMLSTFFYKFLLTIKRCNKNVKFIVGGDFNQLLPVNDSLPKDFNYKNSPAIFELCDGNRIQLSYCRRSDDELFNLVKFENIMNLKKEDFNNNIKTEMHLAFTNNKRKSINEALMNKWIKQKRLKPIHLKALDYDQNSQDVNLCVLRGDASYC
jgi:ATP-dependent exoDNAse (exonuclease V) alpha subunit